MEIDDFLIKLGEHIKSLRQAKNITVKELARRTGKTQATKQNNSWRLSKKILHVIMRHYNSL